MSVSAISSINLYPVLATSTLNFNNAIQNNGSGAGSAGQRQARAPARQASETTSAAPAAPVNEPKSTYLTLDTSSYADLTSWGWNAAAA